MEIRPMTREERPLAARAIASGMAENPIHVAIQGPDREARLRGLELGFGAILRVTERPALVSLDEAGELVGAAVWGPPGACPLPEERREALAKEASALPPAVRERFLAWRATWAANDPTGEPHWHLGPFAVRADRRGRGIGTALLEEFLVRVDEAEGIVYLETDTERNARYYERFGFATVGQAEVLGVRCRFMSRRRMGRTT